MEETYLVNVEGVKKKILHGGYGELPEFKDGSKVTFHFQTLKDDFERTVIDDSRVAGIPMEIIVGKMFKIEIWETLLTSMRIGEVAEFWCDAVHTGMYALVSKGMRKIAEGKDPLDGQKHRCGMGNMFDYHSTGYGDLDELQRTPQPLIFIMELFKVEDPSSYKRDTWAMNNEEKLAAVPQLHTEGNRLVLARKFKEAAEKYQEAIICLRNVQSKEKPWDEDWLKLEKLITPLVLNYCQCQLELGEYYEVLEHTTDLLQKNNKNVKAYFKRAKAHSAVWNEKEARVDFLRAAQLDPSLAAAVRKELKLLGERMRRKHVEDRKRYQGLFQQPSKAKTEVGQSEGTEELSEEKEEVEESHKGNLWKSEVTAEGMEKNGEMERGKEGKEELMVKLGKRGEEDCFSQSEGEKMKIEVGNNQGEEQGHGREDGYSRGEVTGCETSEEKQLGVAQRESKEEKENTGVGWDIQTEEEERRAIYGKTAGLDAESMTKNTGEESVQGRREGFEEVSSTKDGENKEAKCGTGEVTTGAQRVQNIMCFGAQNVKEQDRKSSEEVSQGNCFEVQNDASKGGARLEAELNFGGERSSEQEVCGWSWKERAIREKEEHLDGTELQKTEAEANQGRHGGNTEDHPLAAGDGGTGARDEAETRLRMENSKEEKQNSSEEAEHGKEGMKPGFGSEIPEAMTSQEGLERIIREENPETEQADLPVS